MKLWLAERETFYPVEIHTANPVGRANMERILARYWENSTGRKFCDNLPTVNRQKRFFVL